MSHAKHLEPCDSKGEIALSIQIMDILSILGVVDKRTIAELTLDLPSGAIYKLRHSDLQSLSLFLLSYPFWLMLFDFIY